MLMKTPETQVQQNIQKVIDKLESIKDVNFNTADVFYRRRQWQEGNDDDCFVGCVFGWARRALDMENCEAPAMYNALGIGALNSDQAYLRATIFGGAYCTREDAIRSLRYMKEGDYKNAYVARHHGMPSP